MNSIKVFVYRRKSINPSYGNFILLKEIHVPYCYKSLEIRTTKTLFDL